MKIHFACVIEARTSLDNKTGAWRVSRPVLTPEKCTRCGLCELYCPDSCVLVIDEDYLVDYDYCKGCGICAHECPAGAIQMIPE